MNTFAVFQRGDIGPPGSDRSRAALYLRRRGSPAAPCRPCPAGRAAPEGAPRLDPQLKYYPFIVGARRPAIGLKF